MTENELWTGCVTDFRALDAGRKKSWVWEPDFRALDLGRKKSRVWEPIFHALDPKNEKSRVREPIFRALDPKKKKRSRRLGVAETVVCPRIYRKHRVNLRIYRKSLKLQYCS